MGNLIIYFLTKEKLNLISLGSWTDLRGFWWILMGGKKWVKWKKLTRQMNWKKEMNLKTQMNKASNFLTDEMRWCAIDQCLGYNYITLALTSYLFNTIYSELFKLNFHLALDTWMHEAILILNIHLFTKHMLMHNTLLDTNTRPSLFPEFNHLFLELLLLLFKFDLISLFKLLVKAFLTAPFSKSKLLNVSS